MSHSSLVPIVEQLKHEIAHQVPYYFPWKGEGFAFHDLPFSNKQLINKHRDQLERMPQGKIYDSYTSGTTGIPYRCIRSAEEQCKLSAAIFRNRRRWGVPLRHRMLLLSNRMSDEPKMMQHYVQQMSAQQPHFIQGRFSSLFQLAQYMKEQQIQPPPGLLFIQNWGESVIPSQRAFVESVFGVRLADYYGLEEMWLIAFEAPDGRFIVDEQVVFVEVIDPDTLQPVADGEYGEIVVTSLVMRTVPYIRYRTGDIGKIWRDEHSGGLCIHLMPMRMSQIILPNRQVNAAFFRYFDKFFYDLFQQQSIRQFQIVQTAYTSFTLRVAADEHVQLEHLEKSLHTLLGNFLHIEVDVSIERVSRILSNSESGKVPFFVTQVQVQTEQAERGVVV
ncbi:phenylacetate--CoA ligase family protein [Paenibacillus arenosi]|uniref:Phenylacetate--CoA ligase family protein n=1 Tax=Paenibacillus arenosi TaxID=2774142 RepID=A0ABR9AUH7_9BACL|nr:phenylacetate--CoA ligase family protein [Paenibacillus arenosi]MBD8497776.1 phenylacetate--CoA ligase family protein [Paenibacillus arenosi]